MKCTFGPLLDSYNKLQKYEKNGPEWAAMSV